MHKRQQHHILVSWVRPFKYRYLLIILLVSGGVSLLALRQNNLTALRLRDRALKVDEQNGDIETALRDLREYTYAHMNARLSSDSGIYPPVQLKFRYERLVAAEKERVNGANAGVYQEAQASCEARFPEGLSGRNRIPCIQEYVDSHGAAKEQAIPDALYKFDFVSPSWSPDLAGWALGITGVVTLLLVIRFAAEQWLKSRLG